MSAEAIGLLSGGLVVLSIIPYAVRVWQGKIHPVPTSWVLWSLIGLALLLTYRSSGATANVWPAVFGFTNPAGITILCLFRGERWEKPAWYEVACFLLSVLALGAWVIVHDSKELSQYALCAAIAADLCAAIPTFVFFRRNPEGDRPGPWFLFAAGYFLGIFAITDATFSNYVLPVYMSTGSVVAASLLAVPRFKRKIPLKEWI